MNIFFLDLSVALLAAYHCDKHIVKMPLEITQMLYTACSVLLDPVDSDWRATAPLTQQGRRGYKRTHQNHPMTCWVRASTGNFTYAVLVGLALCAEYTRRYRKVMLVEEHLWWLQRNCPLNMPEGPMTLPPQCMPDQYKCSEPTSLEDIVEAYRRFYIGDKLSFARYTDTLRPDWLPPSPLKRKQEAARAEKEDPLPSKRPMIRVPLKGRPMCESL